MTPRAYPFAETFHAPQGEGQFCGTQMTFLRLVGCSVGKGTCTHCDTDFDAVLPTMGGGMLTPEEVLALVGTDRHVCLTGGEPLDRDLRPLLTALMIDGRKAVHVETSGTKWPDWLDRSGPIPGAPRHTRTEGRRFNHAIGHETSDGTVGWYDYEALWVTISPKPGFHEEMVRVVADEVKVILGGLGDGPGWPTLDDAVRWADMGKLVFVQPRNGTNDVDRARLDSALKIVSLHPQLRISPQVHKFLRVR